MSIGPCEDGCKLQGWGNDAEKMQLCLAHLLPEGLEDHTDSDAAEIETKNMVASDTASLTSSRFPIGGSDGNDDSAKVFEISSGTL